MSKPHISIVTPSFNQAQYIEQTILSVLEQNYVPLEYIVIDGGSTDGTLEILKRYEDRLRWISEPDDGQADAINKGFRLASGDIFGWLNADDLYTPNALHAVAKSFEKHPDISFIYGDAQAIDEHDRLYGIRTHVSQTDFHTLVNVGDAIVQPAAFWRRQLWEAVGELDKSLHYTLDYEYWMRAARDYEFRYIPVCLATERLYGNAKTFSGSLERLEELEQITDNYGGSGLPSGFHAEAASAYLVHALKLLLRGQWKNGVSYVKKARTFHPPLGLFLRYFGVMLLFGYRGVAWIWLRMISFRQNRKQQTTYPVELN